MEILRVKDGRRVITVKKMKLKDLKKDYINQENVPLNEDEVFLRCNKRGIPKLYLNKYIIYPTTMEIVRKKDYSGFWGQIKWIFKL